MDELTTNVEIGKNGESRSGEGFLLSHFKIRFKNRGDKGTQGLPKRVRVSVFRAGGF